MKFIKLVLGGERERARRVGEERSGEKAAPGSGRARDGGALGARRWVSEIKERRGERLQGC